MVSPAHSDELRGLVREIIARRLVGPFADELSRHGAPDADLRAEILVALTVGVSLTRGCGTLPALARAPLGDVLAVLDELIAALRQDGS
jgi:hypothetical protein